MATVNVNELTAEELDQLVADAARVKTEKAQSRVTAIDDKIAALEAQIVDLKNERSTLPGVKTRVVGQRALRLFIVDAIRGGAKTKAEITDAVLEAGYLTNASDFASNVYQALHTGINAENPYFAKTDDHEYSVVESGLVSKPDAGE